MIPDAAGNCAQCAGQRRRLRLRDKGAVQGQTAIAEAIRHGGKILRQLRKEERVIAAEKDLNLPGKRCSSGRIRFSPASRAACSTLRVVCGDTPPRSFSTRSTVATPTPICLASIASEMFFIAPLFMMEIHQNGSVSEFSKPIMVAASLAILEKNDLQTFCPVGSGFIGQVHAASLARHEGSALTMVADTAPERAQRWPPAMAPGR